MSDLTLWIVIALLTLSTFITRATFWLIGHHINLPKRVHEALRFAPACALAAILIPDFLTNHHQIELSITNPQLVAGVCASVFFLIKPSMLGTIFFGMAVFTTVRLLA
ncbi:AzlD domain-containing protein [Solimicrobium silvestre]|uniref:Putative membrane protein n=1 Tax=Solimicrobium silvestre TaxID=2099400 RepID=A0A2S9GXG8_9BURK|nr:AzlD domain-containing protein [Solimicrobium silvestre]PRC92401.1 putative membrane protein [Solimicrobium silvestre]